MVPWWRLGSIQCFFDLHIILLVTEGPSFHSSTRTHLLTITIITEGRAVLSGLRPFQRSPATSICVYLRVCKISIFLLRWKRRWVQRVATTGWEKEDFKTINPKKQVNIRHTHKHTHAQGNYKSGHTAAMMLSRDTSVLILRGNVSVLLFFPLPSQGDFIFPTPLVLIQDITG